MIDESLRGDNDDDPIPNVLQKLTTRSLRAQYAKVIVGRQATSPPSARAG